MPSISYLRARAGQFEKGSRALFDLEVFYPPGIQTALADSLNYYWSLLAPKFVASLVNPETRLTKPGAIVGANQIDIIGTMHTDRMPWGWVWLIVP